MKKSLKMFTRINIKIYILLMSIILGLSGVLTTMLGIYSQQYNYYEFYSYDNIDKVSIDSIYIGDSLASLNNYEYKNTLYNEKEKNLKVTKNSNNIFYKITVSKIDNFKISLKNESDSAYKILINKNGKNYATFNIDEGKEYSFADNNGTLSILKSIIFSMDLKEILIYITILILLVLISYFSIKYIYKFILDIKNNIFSIKKYIVSIILYFILNLLYMYLLMQFVGKLCIFPSVLFLIFSLIFLKDIIKENLSYSFLIIGMVIGVLFILIFPPLHIPDETSHFVKTYQQSYIFQEKHIYKGNEAYAYLPKDMRRFINKYGSYASNSDYVMQPRTYLFDLYKPANYKDYSEKYNWYGTRFSSPLPYVIGTIVALIARITNMPVFVYYLLGKLFTLIISLVMCYYALKIVPKFKKVFFITMLLPMFFQQCAGYCVDWLTNASFLLITSMILKEIYSKGKINKKNISKITVLLVILGLCKFGYFSISFLLLLIPKEKYNFKSEKIKMFFIMLIPLVVSIFITYLYRALSSNIPVENYRDCISISMLFQNPKEIILMIIETFKIRLDLDFIRGMITGFGWYTFWLNDLYLFISMFILTMLIICSDDNNEKLSIKQYSVIFSIFLIICGIIYGAMLFGWTIKGSTSIDGLQPRYFIPPALLLYILLQSNFVKIKVKNSNLLYSLSMIILNIFALITIIETIYI